MKKFILLSAALISAWAGMAQYNLENLTVDLSETIRTNYIFEHLGLFPIRANETFLRTFDNVGDFANLEEAITEEKIVVSEVDEGGSVNTLFAENISSDTIFILAGEVVKGGKQDRIIAQDFLIAPGEKVNLSAFCVEQGRWHSSEDGVAEFNDYFHISGNSIRKVAVKEKSQSGVWNKVAELTGKNDATSSSGTYTALGNSEEYQESLSGYLEKFTDVFADDPSIIGVVAVTGNKIIGCDLFATHAIFAESFNNLLHAYTTDAITDGATVEISNTEIQEYLATFLADESKQEESLREKGALFKHKNRKLHMSSF